MPQMSPLSWSLFLTSFSLMFMSCMVILFFYHYAKMSESQPKGQLYTSTPIVLWKW